MRWLSFFLAMSVHVDLFSQWQQIYPLSYTLMDVAVANENTVYCAVGESFILKSAHRGRNWEKIQVGQEQLIVLFFQDSLSGFAVSVNAVYKTTNGGKSWIKVALPLRGQQPTDIVFSSKNIGYISFGNSKLAKTTDAGESWKILPNAPSPNLSGVNRFSFAGDDVGYLIADFKLYKTINGGDSWSQIPTNYFPIGIFALDHDTAYLCYDFETVKTVNGGATWEYLSSGAAFIYFRDANEGVSLVNYSEALQTHDGGLNFQLRFNSNFVFRWSAISFSGSFGCAIGGDNALVITEDGGTTWKVANINSQHGIFRESHFSTANDGFIVGDESGFLRTHDNGASWYYDEGILRNDIHQLAFSGPDTGVFIVTNNYAYFTNDGGKSMHEESWTVPIIGDMQSADYEMINSKIMYTVGQKVKVAKSTNRGQSWEAFTFDFSNPLKAIACYGADTCHAAGLAGMVISTWDGGKHWKVHNLLLNNDLSCVYLPDSLAGLIGGNLGVILKSSDAGQSWTVLNTKAYYDIIGFNFITPKKGYAVSRGGEILRTEDKGTSWELIRAAPAGNYLNLHGSFMRDTSAIFGVSEKQIYKWTRESKINTITGTENLRPENSDFAVFPNPAEGRISVSGNGPIREIKVVDLCGSVRKQSEDNTREVDLSDLTPGLYIVYVVHASGVFASKVFKR
jgi:photosystem II stability/assembly factor-like uncharacterized protein